ncbi:ribonuclease H-like YkuK family protein [Candidatus Gottesmanbacteria bacterium]|nr:ribonuclease H-like YkuK family protein [Candidatus Gottesmanbacteria bacterium]
MDKTVFNSPTFGVLTLADVRQKVLEFMAKLPEYKYQLVIGTDSQPKNGSGCDFVTAIVVHRIGTGGVYFWKRIVEKKSLHLRNRIYKEATFSLTCAEELLAAFKNDGITKYDVEIHVDIGNHGKTREMIAEIVGMVRGSGFIVKTKPDSYGASKVADRHT